MKRSTSIELEVVTDLLDQVAGGFRAPNAQRIQAPKPYAPPGTPGTVPFISKPTPDPLPPGWPGTIPFISKPTPDPRPPGWPGTVPFIVKPGS